MANSPAPPPEKALTSVKDVLEKWSDPQHSEDITCGWDWRSRTRPFLKAGDIRGMRQAALPSVQYGVIELAHEAKNESVRLQASQLLLAQEGHGPINKTEATLDFVSMPKDQLAAILAAKIARIIQLDPTFDFQKLMSRVKVGADAPDPIPTTALAIEAIPE